MNNIEILEDYIEALRKPKPFKYTNEQKAQAIENLIQEYKELKEKLEEKDMQHELELIGKEEYTKDAMGEIIEHYYTANEDCIPKSKVKEKIEDLEKQAEEVKNHYKGTYACLDEYLNAKSKIQGFKELLEEGE